MKIKRFLFIIFAVVFGIFTAITTNNILIRKTAQSRLYDLMESPLDTDIFFLGSSRIMDGIIPVQLWKEKGYTSYILCAEYNDMDRDIMMLRLALQYKKPRLVVLDVHNYWEKSEHENVLTGYQEFTDAFPLSPVKVKTTLELFGDNTDRLKILFPFYIYHNRWNDLKSGDFYKNKDSRFLKGFEYSDDVKEILLPQPINGATGALPDVYGVGTIRNFVNECRSLGIEVMFLNLPFEADLMEQSYLTDLSQLADELDVKYVDMLEIEGIADGDSDFKDEGHMNVYGAEKATRYIGRFIEDHYDIPSRSDDAPYREEWDKGYEKFMKYID